MQARGGSLVTMPGLHGEPQLIGFEAANLGTYTRINMDQNQGGREHRCSQCNKTFSSSDELRKHNETAHGGGKSRGQNQPGSGSGSQR